MKRSLVLSESDFANLNVVIDGLKLSGSNDGGCLQMLEDELDEAKVLKRYEMPTDVVRMNSQVYVTDLDSGEGSLYTLVFPQDANMERHRVSVLAPLGAALLGARAGRVITPITPRGRRRLRVGAIAYQNRAAQAA